MSATVVVVLDVDVLVELLVLVVLVLLAADVVVRIVDVVGGSVVADALVADAASDSSPHDASAINAALASANHPRRIVTVCQRSALQQRRRSLLTAADTGWDADAVVAGTAQREALRQ